MGLHLKQIYFLICRFVKINKPDFVADATETTDSHIEASKERSIKKTKRKN